VSTIKKGASKVNSPSGEGTDIYSPEKRSEIMGRVKGRDTKPELVVRSLIHRMGFRFRLYASRLPGRPDIILPRHKKVVFVHGCFWHQHPNCSRAKLPQTRAEWWLSKLSRNRQRDAEIQEQLQEQGWKVLVVWQCQLRDSRALNALLRKFLGPK
jgi:DNA mismatch endonuclease (patch repair protein)